MILIEYFHDAFTSFVTVMYQDIYENGRIGNIGSKTTFSDIPSLFLFMPVLE